MGILNKLKRIFNKNDSSEVEVDNLKPAYESDYEGFIGNFDLDKWWEKEFSEEEREYIISKKPDLIEGHYIDKSPTQYLQELSLWFTSKKDRDISLKLLNKAEEFVDDKEDLHFMYNSKIKSLYKKRNEDEVYLQQCIEYCKKDIELYEDELSKMSFFKDNNTRIPAFQRLAIIYEKRKEYNKAIEICKKAIKYDMREKNKDGFEDRLERLELKLEL